MSQASRSDVRIGGTPEIPDIVYRATFLRLPFSTVALQGGGDLPELMIRKAFKMAVHPGAHAEYERRHRPIWKELEDALFAHGVRSYSIFLEPANHDLFGYAEIESEERWQAIAKTEICQRWWHYMRDLMPTNPDNSPTSIELREVFHIESGPA